MLTKVHTEFPGGLLRYHGHSLQQGFGSQVLMETFFPTPTASPSFELYKCFLPTLLCILYEPASPPIDSIPDFTVGKQGSWYSCPVGHNLFCFLLESR